ncbi:hypothetical protein D027_0909A, partial [Vibrio parahaemolyticus 861]|jgi:hypothetical protein
MSNS